MAIVNTSAEWGTDLVRYRLARKWNDASQTVQNDLRMQIKVREQVLSIGLLGVLDISFTSWTDWKDMDSLPVVDIVS